MAHGVISEKVKWIRLAVIIIPLLVLLCGINYYEDPANLFHDYNENVAKALLDGHEAYFGSGNGDERSVKMHTIRNMPQHVECITLGPSLAMGISKEHAGTESYYNLSASGLNFNDFMGEIALLEISGVTYDRLIYCVDSYFFDETFAAAVRNPDIMKYAEYMMAKLDGKNPSVPEEKTDTGNIKTQIGQLFSVTYFQDCVDYIRSNQSVILKEKRWGIIDEDTKDLAHYASDGSWVYDAEYRNRTVEDVINSANVYQIEHQFAYDRHLSGYYKDYFEKLISYLVERNITVEFFLCPVCPALQDRLEADKSHYFLMDELEVFAHRVADRYGIRVTGSYDPYAAGVSDDDFWDCRHMRHDRLGDYFDFKE